MLRKAVNEQMQVGRKAPLKEPIPVEGKFWVKSDTAEGGRALRPNFERSWGYNEQWAGQVAQNVINNAARYNPGMSKADAEKQGVAHYAERLKTTYDGLKRKYRRATKKDEEIELDKQKNRRRGRKRAVSMIPFR